MAGRVLWISDSEDTNSYDDAVTRTAGIVGVSEDWTVTIACLGECFRSDVETLPSVSGNRRFWRSEARRALDCSLPWRFALILNYPEPLQTFRVMSESVNLLKYSRPWSKVVPLFENLSNLSSALCFVMKSFARTLLLRGWVKLMALTVVRRAMTMRRPRVRRVASALLELLITFDLVGAGVERSMFAGTGSGLPVSEKDPLLSHPCARRFLAEIQDHSQADTKVLTDFVVKFAPTNCANLRFSELKLLRLTQSPLKLSFSPPPSVYIRAVAADSPLPPKTLIQELTAVVESHLQVPVYTCGSAFANLNNQYSDFDFCFLLPDVLRTDRARELIGAKELTDVKLREAVAGSSDWCKDAAVVIVEDLSVKLALEFCPRGAILLQRSRARKPVINIQFEDVRMSFDVCCSNDDTGIRNSVLLKHYASMDPRFPQLARLVKFWSQRRSINGASNGNLSSYAFTLSVLHFLIVEGVLANIQIPDQVAQAFGYRRSFNVCDENLCLTEQGEAQLPWQHWRSSNRATIEELFLKYIRFYVFEHDWAGHIVSPRCAPIRLSFSRWFFHLHQASISGDCESSSRTPSFDAGSVSTTHSERIHRGTPIASFTRIGRHMSYKTKPIEPRNLSPEEWLYAHPAHDVRKYALDVVLASRERPLLAIECPVENYRLFYPTTEATSDEFARFATLHRVHCVKGAWRELLKERCDRHGAS